MNFINPGIKINLKQYYTVTWNNQVIFVVHDEETDLIQFNSYVDDDDRFEIEKFIRSYLTNQ